MLPHSSGRGTCRVLELLNCLPHLFKRVVRSEVAVQPKLPAVLLQWGDRREEVTERIVRCEQKEAGPEPPPTLLTGDQTKISVEGPEPKQPQNQVPRSEPPPCREHVPPCVRDILQLTGQPGRQRTSLGPGRLPGQQAVRL